MSTVLKENDNYVIITYDNFNFCKQNLFCIVCEYVLKSGMDVATHDKYLCCHDCFLRFAESRKEEWLNGWRPTKKEIIKTRIEKDRIFIK